MDGLIFPIEESYISNIIQSDWEFITKLLRFYHNKIGVIFISA